MASWTCVTCVQGHATDRTQIPLSTTAIMTWMLHYVSVIIFFLETRSHYGWSQTPRLRDPLDSPPTGLGW